MADADTGAKPVDEDTLVADIDRTRTELARTIDAISDRVSPKKNVDRAMEEARQRADRAVEEARQRADRAVEQLRQRTDQAIKQVRQGTDQAMKQVRQGVSQIDPVLAGAVAAAVAVSITALVLWRRRH